MRIGERGNVERGAPARPPHRARGRRRWWIGLPIVAILAVAVAAPIVTALSGASRPGVSDVVVESAALGRSMPAQVFVPARLDPNGRYPVLYLFHGRYGTERGWMGGSFGREGVEIDVIAQHLIDEGRIRPTIIVSAAIEDSYGVDSPPTSEGYDHGPYERYVMDELMPAIEGRFPVSTDPADRFVGGLSMGGFAALHAAFRYPERFGGVAGVSPAIFEGMLPDRGWLYPTPAARRDHDPLLLARSAPLEDLRVFLGAGERDYTWITGATRLLAERLSARGVVAAPVVAAGGHNVRTWQRLAPAMLVSLLGESSMSLGG